MVRTQSREIACADAATVLAARCHVRAATHGRNQHALLASFATPPTHFSPGTSVHTHVVVHNSVRTS